MAENRSVLLEMSMFPSDVGESKGDYVAKVIETIRESGVKYQLTPMSTIIETETVREAMLLVEKCYEVLDSMDTNRVYSVLKFDIRKGSSDRMSGKIASVEKRIGEVNS
jgi:uncharacterized protein (TIGR00106 family)